MYKIVNNKYRELILWIIIFTLLVLLPIQLIFFQSEHSKTAREFSEKKTERSKTILSKRGSILDRNGKILAEDVPVYEIGIDIDNFSLEPRDIQFIANMLEISTSSIISRLSNKNRKYIVLEQKARQLKKDLLDSKKIPGLITNKKTYSRHYPQGEIFSQLIGLTNYENDGVNGVEFALNEVLEGTNGLQKKIISRKGETLASETIKAKNGLKIQLTVDSIYQFLVFEKLKVAIEKHNADSGSAILLDLNSNEILAMTNFPSFDPNNRKNLKDMELLKNKASIDLFEPGSTIKPLALSTVMNENLDLMSKSIDTSPGWIEYEGYRTEDAKNYGVLSISEIISKSSNVGMVKICQNLDAEKLLKTYFSLGLGSYMNEIFISTREGYLPEIRNLSLREKASLCYGYGLQATLSQLVSSYSALFSGGIMKPLSILLNREEEEGKRVMRKEISNKLKKILKNVVEDGTGQRASLSNINIYGKTGTSRQLKDNKYSEEIHNALFIGMAELESEKYLMGLIVRNPKINGSGGGEVAAPIFSEIIEGIKNL